MTAPLIGSVELHGGMAFRAVGDSGHALLLDAPAEVGGADSGPRPMELLLLGLGACTGMDVISLLRKMRQEVTSYRLELHADRADEHPKVMTAISILHIIGGRGLDEGKVRRAVELSATRYCPASAMLGQAAPIHHHYRIEDTERSVAVEGMLGASALGAGAFGENTLGAAVDPPVD